jgi:hypothetical protein
MQVVPQQSCVGKQVVPPQLQPPIWQPVSMQHTCVGPQAAPPLHVQAPAVHISPGRQALPHMPQLNSSDCVSMQPESQQVWPAAHTEVPRQRQSPPEQLSLLPHFLPHSPQFCWSVSVRRHAPLQHFSSAEQTSPPQR